MMVTARRRARRFRQLPKEGVLFYYMIPHYTLRLEGGLIKGEKKKFKSISRLIASVDTEPI